MVSKGKVMEVPVEPANMSMLKWKAQQAPCYKNSKLWNWGAFHVWSDYIIFGACRNAASNIKRSLALFSEMWPLLSQWNLQAWLLSKDSFIWTINATVYVDIAFCHAALSLFSSQFYQAVNWIPFWPYSLSSLFFDNSVCLRSGLQSHSQIVAKMILSVHICTAVR